MEWVDGLVKVSPVYKIEYSQEDKQWFATRSDFPSMSWGGLVKVSPVYKIEYSQEDKQWFATRSDFPSMSWGEVTAVAALQGLQSLIRKAIRDMEKEKEKEKADAFWAAQQAVRVGSQEL